MRGLSSLPCSVRVMGMVLVEVLVALLLFSVAISGSLQTQLRALGSTRANLAQAQATRLLQDLTQRGAAGTLAGSRTHVPATGNAPHGHAARTLPRLAGVSPRHRVCSGPCSAVYRADTCCTPAFH
jgi:Tfp pilus assembly protein PilV